MDSQRAQKQDGAHFHHQTGVLKQEMPAKTSASSPPSTPTCASSTPSTSRQQNNTVSSVQVTRPDQPPSAVQAHRPDQQLPAMQTHRPDDTLQELPYDEDQAAALAGSNPPVKEGSTKHKEKIGHRRIDKQGEVSYKRVPTNALMNAIQLGINNSIGSLASRPLRDLLVQDFEVIETMAFPTEGSSTTQSHTYGDFRFKTYAPLAFRYFRNIFNIQTDDFLKSLCTQPLRELSNPGASGSIFYVSSDDNFIIKTVQHKEADFLCKLLPGYYMNLQQNPRTLLPKFFGLFCYQSLGKNIRLIVMNNLLPQSIRMHHKFDLKGSTYKRLASRQERSKESPTLKDLDFGGEYPHGITLDPKTYDLLVDTIKRDCLVLESFKIMDYSFLIGIHNIDLEVAPTVNDEDGSVETLDPEEEQRRMSARTEAWRSLQLDFNTKQRIYHSRESGIPARNHKGDRLLLYIGIIDILQNYRLFKKFEHTWKSILHDSDSISVHNPTFYAERFQRYLSTCVFMRAEAGGAGGSKHPNKFRSFVHSYMAIKQHPSRHNRTKSIADIADDVNESLLTQRGGIDRRGHYKVDSDKRKRNERLFASSSVQKPVANNHVGPTILTVGDEQPTSSRPLDTTDIQMDFAE